MRGLIDAKEAVTILKITRMGEDGWEIFQCEKSTADGLRTLIEVMMNKISDLEDECIRLKEGWDKSHKHYVQAVTGQEITP